ncbi:MAG: hypothetical protein GY774_14690 [Planctomycetes bacterium]|nr:hypothetical protein [Planctomycetota bacterium]
MEQESGVEVPLSSRIGDVSAHLSSRAPTPSPITATNHQSPIAATNHQSPPLNVKWRHLAPNGTETAKVSAPFGVNWQQWYKKT